MITRNIMFRLFMLLALAASTAFAQKWTFAVLGDHRAHLENFQLVLDELRLMNANTDPPFKRAEFIAACGDLDLSNGPWDLITNPANEVPPYYPINGNHDFETSADMNLMMKTVLPMRDSIVRDMQINYYIDWKNVRFIALDQYSSYGTQYGVTSAGIDWVEHCTQTAVDADHIFIGFHVPAFARNRYSGKMIRADAFWNMITSYDKVRAVFCAHTHKYSRMRVLDPTSPCAEDKHCFPDDEGGVFQVDCGESGVGWGETSTIVYVQVDGPELSFMVVQGDQDPGNPNFRVHDSWDMQGTTSWIVSAAQEAFPPLFGVRAIPGSKSVDFLVSVDRPGTVVMDVFDISGRRAGQYEFESPQSGHYSVKWNAGGKLQMNAGRGIGFVQLRQGDRKTGKRFVVME